MSKVCSNKKCSHKGNPQPRENFYDRPGYPDGKSYSCKDCERKAAYLRNRERTKANNDFFKLIM